MSYYLECDQSKILHGKGKGENFLREWTSNNITTRERSKISVDTKMRSQLCEIEIFLTRAPILRIIDLEKYFLVHTNACKEGFREVLMQEAWVMCYEL